MSNLLIQQNKQDWVHIINSSGPLLTNKNKCHYFEDFPVSKLIDEQI